MTRSSRNVAQAGVTVVVAGAFAVATYLSGQASERWSQSVTENVKWSAGLSEDARYLFVDEAPFAYEYTVAQERADLLVEASLERPPSEQGAALIEADLIRKSMEIRRMDLVASGDSLLEEEYWVEDHFHIGQRFQDLRGSETVVADPESDRIAGDWYARAALGISLIPLPVAAWYVLAWSRRGRKIGSRPSVSPTGGRDVELIPDPSLNHARRGVALVALGAWILLVILPPLQVYQSLRNSEAETAAANGAVVVMRDVIVGNLVASFGVQVQDRAVSLQGMAERRAINYEHLPRSATRGQGAIVLADTQMKPRYEQLADETIASSLDTPDLDHAATAALAAGPADWARDLTEQRARADQADRASRRYDAMTLALVLAGIATTLAALAQAERRSFTVPIMAGVALIAAGSIALVGSFL
jgi:hypothetical protein